ncbi:MATE family efflux transporter [Allobaculum fili]|uniref:MATE family efflux transporter n=1 Tax=Allobaculum fili TaxID=2834460 RepID=UPI001E2C58EA|nr:MATE family efflux transporter [Allobaculum fili]
MFKSKSSQTDLGTAPVGRLLFNLAVPCILAQIVNVLYNIVDRMYIGHIPGSGQAALTGVGVTMPLITAISAFAYLVCMGAAPRAAVFMGQKDNKTAQKIMNSSLALLILLALVLTVITEVFGRDLLMSFGASEQTIPYAWAYMQIYAAGTIFVQVALGMNAFINTQGYASWGMATVLIGAILNIVLDPILIFVFGLGVRGAAIATVISQACSAIFVLWFLSSKRSALRLSPSLIRLNWKLILPCLALGLSPFVMMITESFITLAFNTSLQRYGGDLAVGSMTILASIMQFAMLPLQGLTQGSQPIISYNFGAANLDRIKKTFKILLISSLIYSFGLWALCELFPGAFASFFTPDPELIKYTEWSLRIYIAGVCLFGMQIACQQTFIALGNAKTSLFLAVYRKIILLLPLIYILPFCMSDKVFAVFLAEPIADVVAAVTTGILFLRYTRTRLPALIEQNRQKLADELVQPAQN